MAPLPLKTRRALRPDEGRPQATAQFSQDTLIAIHTHRIVKAKIEEAEMRVAVAAAMAEAQRAGINPRVMKRALRMLDPYEQELDRAAAEVVRAFLSVPIGEVEAVVATGALLPPGDGASVSASDDAEPA